MSIYKMIRRLGLDKDSEQGRAPTAPGDEDDDSYLTELRAPERHPLGFYLRMGYALTGIVPDANGRGLPGFLLARRLG